MADLFSGTDHAAVYAKYRPTTPQILVDRILAYLKQKHSGPLKAALDVGCGTGQSTRILAPNFEKVTGTDVSESQIEQAKVTPGNPANVEFAVSPAESLDFEDNSLQLITASTAYHYFDHKRFLESAKRVLEPNGVLAVYCCEVLILKGNTDEETSNLKKIILDLFELEMSKYGDGRGGYKEQRYEGVILPFADFVRDERIVVPIQMLFPDYMAYLTTWSAYQKMLQVEGEVFAKTLLQRVEEDVLKVLSVDKKDAKDLKVTIPLRYVLLMGRQE